MIIGNYEKNPPGMTPLRKLIAPPERTVQIVLVISNHEDAAGACPLFRPSFFLSLSLLFLRYTKPFFALPFVLPSSIYACRSVPPNLFAREIFLRVVQRKRILTRDPPRRITCNDTIFTGDWVSDFRLQARSYSMKLIPFKYKLELEFYADRRWAQPGDSWTRLLDYMIWNYTVVSSWKVYQRYIFRSRWRNTPTRMK